MTGENLSMTQGGLVRCRTVRRLESDRRTQHDILRNVRALHWNDETSIQRGRPFKFAPQARAHLYLNISIHYNTRARHPTTQAARTQTAGTAESAAAAVHMNDAESLSIPVAQNPIVAAAPNVRMDVDAETESCEGKSASDGNSGRFRRLVEQTQSCRRVMVSQ